jgi:hypothetical protein
MNNNYYSEIVEEIRNSNFNIRTLGEGVAFDQAGSVLYPPVRPQFLSGFRLKEFGCSPPALFDLSF